MEESKEASETPMPTMANLFDEKAASSFSLFKFLPSNAAEANETPKKEEEDETPKKEEDNETPKKEEDIETSENETSEDDETSVEEDTPEKEESSESETPAKDETSEEMDVIPLSKAPIESSIPAEPRSTSKYPIKND